MAKYIVDDTAAILRKKLKKIKKPTLVKLELEKVRLYESLEGQPLSERLETYVQISDVLLNIEKIPKQSDMFEDYIRIARILSNKFDIVLTKTKNSNRLL